MSANRLLNHMVEVILCTFNGEKFIKEQILSILNQSLPPDSIIIYDDNSTDLTNTIINQIIKENLNSQTKTIITHKKNVLNIGYRNNFIRGIKESNAEIIFLSDQDDIWEKNKVEFMLKQINKYKLDAVCSDSKIFYDKQKNYKSFFSEKGINVKKFNKSPLLSQFRSNSITGSCMCFKNDEQLKKLLPNSLQYLEHDELLGLLFSSIGKIKLIPEQLIKYRQHQTNSLGVNKNSFYERLWNQLFKKNIDSKKLNEYLLNLKKIKNFELNPASFKNINFEIRFLNLFKKPTPPFFYRIFYIIKSFKWILKTKRHFFAINYILNGVN